jgi:uncharacterized protein (TIGR02145 family)
VIKVTDTRDNQTYKVKKMQDGKCWMIDNLKYREEQGHPISLNNTNGSYNTYDEKITAGTNYDVAKYNDPVLGPVDAASERHCQIDDDIMPTGGTLTGCGYLYNWYAATDGTGTYSFSSGDATGNICPTNFKPPRSGSDANFNDYAILNGAMYGDPGASDTDDAVHRANWIRDGAWQGVTSGIWFTDLLGQESSGYWWSSTPISSASAYFLYFNANNVVPTYNYLKYSGVTVRCVLNPVL